MPINFLFWRCVPTAECMHDRHPFVLVVYSVGAKTICSGCRWAPCPWSHDNNYGRTRSILIRFRQDFLPQQVHSLPWFIAWTSITWLPRYCTKYLIARTITCSSRTIKIRICLHVLEDPSILKASSKCSTLTVTSSVLPEFGKNMLFQISLRSFFSHLKLYNPACLAV